MNTQSPLTISEYLIPFLLTQTSAGIAFILTEGMFTVLVVQFFTVILFILKDRSDKRTRREEREERLRIAELTHQGIAAVKEEGGKREERIVASVQEVKAAADNAYQEANNVNVKLASIGIQTKLAKASPENL